LSANNYSQLYKRSAKTEKKKKGSKREKFQNLNEKSREKFIDTFIELSTYDIKSESSYSTYDIYFELQSFEDSYPTYDIDSRSLKVL